MVPSESFYSLDALFKDNFLGRDSLNHFMAGIILVNPIGNPKLQEELFDKISQYDALTGKKIDFYMPGYKTYNDKNLQYSFEIIKNSSRQTYFFDEDLYEEARRVCESELGIYNDQRFHNRPLMILVDINKDIESNLYKPDNKIIANLNYVARTEGALEDFFVSFTNYLEQNRDAEIKTAGTKFKVLCGLHARKIKNELPSFLFSTIIESALPSFFSFF